jgi:hypothetical protein
LRDFPSLQVSNVKVTPLVLPELSEPFDPVVLKGCQAAHPGFPTFTTLPHSPGLANIGANIIGTPSRRESFVIQPKPDPNLTNGNGQTLSKSWIGKSIWINWPYHLEAKCTGILTPHEEWHISKRGQVVQTSATTAAWKELVDRLTGEYRRSGITLGDVKVVLRVEPFVSLFFDKEAGVQKKLYSTLVELPIQLAVRSFPADIRYAEGPAPKVTDLFPSGSKVIYLGEQNFGCVGVATNQKSGNQTQWTITLTLPQPKEPQQFGIQIASTMKIRYINARDVSTSLGITPLVLSRISSAIPIRVGRSTMELGLNIKFERRQLQTFGYTRRVAIPGVSGPNNRPKTVWEYSEKAVHLIASYKAEFPEVFRAVEASPNAKEYHAEDIFGRDASPTPVPTTDLKNEVKKEEEKEVPKKEEMKKEELKKEEENKEESKKDEMKKEDAKEELKKEADSEIQTEEAEPMTAATPTTKTVAERVLAMRRWLASSPAANLELVPCDSVFLSNEQVQAIEEKAIEVGDLQAKGSKTKIIKNVVAEEYFFIEQTATSIQAHQKFELGDRVVYALSSGVVPTGRRGVVVGIYRGQQLATVVFDEEFLSGNRLNGTLLGYRSALVPLTALLNLTHPLNSLMVKSTSGTTQKAQKETLNLASARPPQIIGADKGGRRQQGGGRGGRGGRGGPSNPFGLLS